MHFKIKEYMHLRARQHFRKKTMKFIYTTYSMGQTNEPTSYKILDQPFWLYDKCSIDNTFAPHKFFQRLELPKQRAFLYSAKRENVCVYMGVAHTCMCVYDVRV
jgi:hypothetical protein